VQKLPPHKSSMLGWSKESPNRLIHMRWNWDGLKFVVRYLSIPFSIYLFDMWEWIDSKINKKHIKWKIHSLSLAGRV
jgi:hypothetical protein